MEAIILRKNIEKHIRITAVENEEWKRKAEKACLTESALVRMLMKGYSPKERPDERFYSEMNRLSAIGNNLNQLAKKAHTQGFVDVPMLYREVEALQKLRADIERRFIRPDKSELKWQ